MDKYRQWILENYPTSSEAYGQCRAACQQMKEIFPELTITNGFVLVLGLLEKRTHWWLKAFDKTIIDPTAHQFIKILEYEEIDDSHPERLYSKHKCCECGTYFYEDGFENKYYPCCCKEHLDSYMEMFQ